MNINQYFLSLSSCLLEEMIDQYKEPHVENLLGTEKLIYLGSNNQKTKYFCRHKIYLLDSLQDELFILRSNNMENRCPLGVAEK